MANETKEKIEVIRELSFNNKVDEWCPASTRRLLIKLAQHKPVGVFRHFHMMCLIHLLNHIFIDENDIVFEDYLSYEDFCDLRKKKTSFLEKDNFKFYMPSYKIRPTASQIQKKLNELYNMDLVEQNEIIPDKVIKQIDFKLPQYILDTTASKTSFKNSQTTVNTRNSKTTKH